jgi:hypothetical protein
MANAQEVAQWLIATIRSNGSRRSAQQRLVAQIRKEFGEEWSYRNQNGNWAIDRGVLSEFGKLKDEHIVWERSDQTWRVVDDEQLARLREIEARRKERREAVAARRAELLAARQKAAEEQVDPGAGEHED